MKKKISPSHKQPNLSFQQQDQPVSAGFTIIELLIATAVFSTVLLLCTVALLQIGRVYYKGVTSTQTQEVARQVIDDISRNIQFNGGTVTNTSGASSGKFCVGTKRYSYALNVKLDESTQPNVLVVDDPSICVTDPALDLTTGSPVPGRELLSPNMRLAALSVNGAGDLYTITIKIVYGDLDLSPTGNCEGGAGSQFCAASELTTTVKRRVN